MIDPDGFPVNLMHGQNPAAPKKDTAKLLYNYEFEKPRVRRFQRFQPGPAAVHKVRIRTFQGYNLIYQGILTKT